MSDIVSKATQFINSKVADRASWDSDTVLNQTVQFKRAPIVVPMPHAMFINEATTFNQVKWEDPNYSPYAIAFQMWIRVLCIADKRYDDDNMYNPLYIYLEPLPDYVGRPLEYRLIIFEPPNPKHPIADIYHELCQAHDKQVEQNKNNNENNNNQPPNQQGQVGYIPPGDRTVAAANNGLEVRKSTGSKSKSKFEPKDKDKEDPDVLLENKAKGGVLTADEQFHKMRNLKAMIAIESLISRKDMGKLGRSSAIVDPRTVYSFTNALMCATHNMETGLGVAANKRNLMNYIYNPEPRPQAGEAASPMTTIRCRMSRQSLNSCKQWTPPEIAYMSCARRISSTSSRTSGRFLRISATCSCRTSNSRLFANNSTTI